MNLVVMSAFLGRARPIAFEILRHIRMEHEIRAVLRVRPAPRTITLQKLREASWSKLIRVAEERCVYQPMWRRRDAKLERRFGRDGACDHVSDTRDIPAEGLTAPSTRETLLALETDVLLVIGAPLLPPEVFEAPRVAAVNVHLGISPNYRGEHTEFWPMLLGDWDNVGATLHRIDRGIDTGPILAHVFPALEPGDDDVRILEKMGRAMAPVVREYLRVPASPGIAAHTLGRPSRLWLGRRRRLIHDVRFQLLKWTGRRRVPRRPQRIDRYFPVVSPQANERANEVASTVPPENTP